MITSMVHIRDDYWRMNIVAPPTLAAKDEDLMTKIRDEDPRRMPKNINNKDWDGKNPLSWADPLIAG